MQVRKRMLASNEKLHGTTLSGQVKQATPPFRPHHALDRQGLSKDEPTNRIVQK